MCGRFTSTATPEELMRRFGVIITENLRPRWNVAPSQSATVIIRDGLHTEAISAKWGLRHAGGNKGMLINARMETANEKPTFSGAFLHSRCIVVASGWYEWSAPKTPWHIQLRDGEVMAMAGLLFRGESQSRFVIVTSAADGELAEIHHRQPLVLGAGDEENWLNGSADQASALCKVTPASRFNWYRVSPDVGKVAVDHPDLITPLKRDEFLAAKDNQGDLFY
jgi:putative SOS response-associated peptidase YedK